MSLDGFIAGPGDSMAWAFGHASGPNAAVGEVVRTTGAILAGRRWYELAHDDPDAAPYGGAWSGPIMVMTHRPPEPSPDARFMFLSGEIAPGVRAALAAAGGKSIVVFGASIARQCLHAGLLDEVLVHVAPVLLGDGLRLFEEPGGTTIALELISLERWGSMSSLRYRVPHTSRERRTRDGS
jgi:dihydrofolate reductase